MIDVFEMENPDPIYKIAVTTWTNIEYPCVEITYGKPSDKSYCVWIVPGTIGNFYK